MPPVKLHLPDQEMALKNDTSAKEGMMKRRLEEKYGASGLFDTTVVPVYTGPQFRPALPHQQTGAGYAAMPPMQAYDPSVPTNRQAYNPAIPQRGFYQGHQSSNQDDPLL